MRWALHEHFGGFAEGVAYGVRLRHDHGSQFMSDDFQNEIAFLGIETSPAFVRDPEGNGFVVPHPISWTVFLIIVMQQPRGQAASDEPAAGIGN